MKVTGITSTTGPSTTGPSTTGPLDGTLLSVRDLTVSFNTENGRIQAVRGVNFDLHPGEILAIVGESGSGKSVTSMAVMGLLPPTAAVHGSVRLAGKELIGLSDKQLSAHRGNDIAMVFQDPLSALTPVLTIGRQITDAIKVHNPTMTRAEVINRAIELLTLVGIPSPESRMKSLPLEFSGGMRQRVMIAIAMANNPSVLVCDEPTTALDVTIQAQILEVLKDVQRVTNTAVIMITHDLGVVAGFADRVMVMYAGLPVETANADDLFAKPKMPYTMGLLAAVPRLVGGDKSSLVAIDGTPPNLLNPPAGCAFAARCPVAEVDCLTIEPQLRHIDDGHQAACLRIDDITERAEAIFTPQPTPTGELEQIPRSSRDIVLNMTNVVRHFPLTKGSVRKRRVGTVRAVDGVSLEIRRGECLALVGESGSGKTTTLLELMDFRKHQPGNINIDGVSNHSNDKTALRRVRSKVQMVFQDPMGALDPRFTVYEVLAEPLKTMGSPSARIRERVFELMKLVGFEADHVNRFPVQFSGGQRQRIGIARALATHPDLLVLDEPVSALDVSVQAGIINLLSKLKAELGVSYLLVAHDLSVVRHISDRIAVMYLGRIVEYGDSETVFNNPQHPYTQALMSAIPVPDPGFERRRKRIVLHGDLPSPTRIPNGCGFADRCPIYASAPPQQRRRCETEQPELHDVATGSDHTTACFYPRTLI